MGTVAEMHFDENGIGYTVTRPTTPEEDAQKAADAISYQTHEDARIADEFNLRNLRDTRQDMLTDINQALNSIDATSFNALTQTQKAERLRLVCVGLLEQNLIFIDVLTDLVKRAIHDED